MLESFQTLSTRYLELIVQGAWVSMVLLAALGILFMVVRDRSKDHSTVVRVMSWTFMAGCLGWGIRSAWQQRAIFDDAFVTFRYIENFVNGKGLVFNEGEYVEGYTNALWALLVMIGHVVTGLEIPLTAVILNGLVYLALVATAIPVANAISGRPSNPIPIAAGLLAAQVAIAAYATTGMETLLGAWLVLAAAGLLHRGEDRHIGAAGLLLALAVVHRMDHAIFWCAGVLAVGVTLLQRPADRRVRPVLLYLAPTILIIAHLAFKYVYYGDILPNTYYAKQGPWRPDQGFAYGYMFLLGSHGWIALPVAAAFLLLPRDFKKSGAVRLFIGASIVVWILYLFKVGGDFMYSRFLLPIVPLVLVAGQAAIYEARKPLVRIALAAALLSTGGGTDIVQRGGHYFGQANENKVYPIRTFFPVRIGHASWEDGKIMRRYLKDRGIEAYVGTCCIGMVSYYSQLKVMDFHGLTDAEVARTEITERGIPGHEKYAPVELVRQRGVQLARGRTALGVPRFVTDLAKIHAKSPDGRFQRKRWGWAYWDADLIAEVREKSPELRFRDVPSWIDDYTGTVYRKDRNRVKGELEGLKRFYFDHNDDPARLAPLQAYVDGAAPPPPGPNEWKKYQRWKRDEEAKGRTVDVPPPPRPAKNPKDAPAPTPPK